MVEKKSLEPYKLAEIFKKLENLEEKIIVQDERYNNQEKWFIAQEKKIN